MTVPATLDRSFRERAASEQLLDVAYDLADTPIGTLLLARTAGGLCRISFDPEPERLEDELARSFGSRLLRVPRPLDDARRQLDEYFEGRRQDFALPIDLRPATDFTRRVLDELARVPYGETTTYGSLAKRAGRPRWRTTAATWASPWSASVATAPPAPGRRCCATG